MREMSKEQSTEEAHRDERQSQIAHGRQVKDDDEKPAACREQHGDAKVPVPLVATIGAGTPQRQLGS
jgi:hypothetical protein